MKKKLIKKEIDNESEKKNLTSRYSKSKKLSDNNYLVLNDTKLSHEESFLSFDNTYKVIKQFGDQLESNAVNLRNDSSYQYQAQDVSYIQQELIKPYQDKFIVQEPIGDDNRIEKLLQNLITLADSKPVLCVYNIGNYHWVTFAAVHPKSNKNNKKTKNKLTILYKDSRGSSSHAFEKKIKQINKDTEVICNTKKEQTEGLDCGIFALQNMKVIADQIKLNRDKFVEEFASYSKFCSLETARKLRKQEFAKKYLLAHCNNIIKSKEDIAKRKLLKNLQENEANKIKVSDFDLTKDLFLKATDLNFFRHTIITEARENIRNILQSNISNKIKIQELEKIEYGKYSPLVHQLADVKDKNKIKELVSVLKDLGDLYKELGDLVQISEEDKSSKKVKNKSEESAKLDDKLKYYSDSAIFYQHVITIVAKKLKPENVVKELDGIYKKLNQINQDIISITSMHDQSKQKKTNVCMKAKENKKSLENLRKKIAKKLEEVEFYRKNGKDQEYAKEGEKLFNYITDEMKIFIAKFFEQAKNEIGELPSDYDCDYTVMGLGSMAINQMTPYSDFESVILTVNENYKNSTNPKITEYFRNLSHLVNFKLINLGESVIPHNKYNVNLDHLVNRGISFDLGGKTPLGRPDREYDLIGTKAKILKYLYNKNNESAKIDDKLPFILEKVCFIYGKKSLVKDYQKLVTNFFNSKKEAQEIPVKIFLEKNKESTDTPIKVIIEKNEQKYCEFRAIQILQGIPLSIKGDLEKLEPLSNIHNGKLLDVKKEIYRIPDRLIYNLGLYYKIEGSSAWDTINKLEARGIINKHAVNHLKYAVTFATTLRLETYLYHKAQKEDIPLFTTDIKQLEKQQDSKFFKFFLTSIQLHQKLKKFCDSQKELTAQNKKSFFEKDDFYQVSAKNKGLIHYKLMQYKEAQKNLKIGLKKPAVNDFDKEQIKDILGRIYVDFDNVDKAIELYTTNIPTFFSRILDKLSITYSIKDQGNKAIEYYDHSPSVKQLLYAARNLDNLAIAYHRKGHADTAIECYNYSLSIKQQIYKSDLHPSIAGSLDNLGLIYSSKGQYKVAMECHTKSMRILKEIYKNVLYSVDIAGSLNNLGIILELQGEYDKAVEYYKKSLKIYNKNYGREHLSVADVLNNLGVTYFHRWKYTQSDSDNDKAMQYHKESLNIKQQIYKSDLHPSIAGSLDNLGLIYSSKGQYNQAIEYHEKSYNIYKKTYKGERHSVADVLNNLGSTYFSKGKYVEAIEYYKKSLNIYKIVYKDGLHISIASSLENLGMAYKAKGEYDTAIKYHMQSLKIRKKNYKDGLHISIASSLENLGMAYKAKGEYDTAIKYHMQSLNISEVLFKDTPHNLIGSSSNNLGVAYYAKGKYNEAIHCFNSSLSIKQQIYKSDLHPSLISSFDNLGKAYQAIGKYDKAILHYEITLRMKESLYKSNHYSLSKTWNDLGTAYFSKGKYDEAIVCHKESLDMYKKVYKDETHISIAKIFTDLGYAYLSKKDYNKAIKCYERSLNISNKIYNKRPDESIAASLNNLGSAHFSKGDYGKAIDYHKKGLEIRKKLYQNDLHPSIDNCFESLGLAYFCKGDYNTAVCYYEKSLNMRNQIYMGKLNHKIADSLYHLGEVYWELGDKSKAIELYKQNYLINSKILGGKHPNTQNDKFLLQRVAFDFLKSNESRDHILKIGNSNLDILKVKLQIQSEVLNKLHALEKIKPLTNNNYLKKQLGTFVNDQNLEIAKMLCFEAINIGIMSNNKKEKDFTCAKEFTKTSPKLVNKIAILHPEYFVDGSILKACKDIAKIDDKLVSELVEVNTNGRNENNTILSLSNSHLRSITKFKKVPEKSKNDVRIISYNITADFFDNKDKSEDGRHKYETRAPFIKQLLGKVGGIFADIFCLQELSPEQALDLQQYFGGKFGYKAIFLSQTPSEIKVGKIVYDEEVKDWCGKRAGTPLIGTFISKDWEFQDEGRFWLKEKPDALPDKFDRGETDKGFGNMNSYRAVLWAKITNSSVDSDKALFIFNSHYPLDGNNTTRKKCAKTEMNKIKKIAKDDIWVSAGDRNLINIPQDKDDCSLKEVYEEFVKKDNSNNNIYDIRDSNNHYGISTSWLGFLYDKFKNKFNDKKGDFTSNSVLDLMFSNIKSKLSFHLHGAFDVKSKKLLANDIILTEDQVDLGYFTSDHALIGADFNLENIDDA